MKRKTARLIRVALVVVGISAIAKFAAFYAAVIFAAYLLYVAVFALKRKRARYRADTRGYKLLTVLGYLFLVPGLPMDWLLNVLSTVVFADYPATWHELFTGRMRRYLRHEPSGSWRFRAAYLLCKYLLHPWDENHCGALPEAA